MNLRKHYQILLTDLNQLHTHLKKSAQSDPKLQALQALPAPTQSQLKSWIQTTAHTLLTTLQTTRSYDIYQAYQDLAKHLQTFHKNTAGIFLQQKPLFNYVYKQYALHSELINHLHEVIATAKLPIGDLPLQHAHFITTYGRMTYLLLDMLEEETLSQLDFTDTKTLPHKKNSIRNCILS